ncbi:MAG: methyltransferase domain-containing protein [Thermoanaerobaculia bacterium]
MLDVLSRLKRRWRDGPAGNPPTLSPAEGYRRWAPAYGVEPNAFQRLEAEVLERLLPELRGQAVLDLGCGRGRIAALAVADDAARVVATDLSLAMLAGSPASAEHVQRLASALPALPFRPASFDTVVCALVLGHVADLGAALAAIAAVLRPGGCLVLSDFHPSASLRGWERTFVDPESGRSFAIEHHLHLLADYQTAFRDQGLRLEALEEPTWEGTPVAFVMRARKE